MENCLLCQENPADKKGSHIVPHFLLQSMYNQDGKKGRDYEVSMEIGLLSLGNYFGRSVSVEKINSVLGREIEDEEISDQSNPFVLDHFLCTNCEKRLSTIESFYARESSKNLKCIEDKIYESGCSAIISTLFWASVIWRIYVTRIAEVSKDDEFFEVVRKILNRCLDIDEKNLFTKSEENRNQINSMRYSLIKCNDLGSETGSLFIISPENIHPYSCVINEHVVFFGGIENFNSHLLFFDLEKHIEKFELNPTSSYERLVLLSEKEFRSSVQKIFNFKSKLYAKGLENHLNYLHTQLFNKPVPDFLLNSSMHRIIHENKGELTVSERYDLKRVCNIFADEIRKLAEKPRS